MKTPWGESQFEKEIADGITLITTSRHGGARLSPDRQKQLKQKLPQFEPFKMTLSWLEEDCDIWAIFLAFADEPWVKPEDVHQAIKVFENHHQNVTIPPECLVIRDKFIQDMTGQWEVRSTHCGIMPDEYVVTLIQVPNGATMKVTMPYPKKKFFTTDELKQFMTI